MGKNGPGKTLIVFPHMFLDTAGLLKLYSWAWEILFSRTIYLLFPKIEGSWGLSGWELPEGP